MPKSSAGAPLAPIFLNKKRKVEIDSVSDEPKLRGDEEERKWKVLAWNVAGLRACVKKSGHSSILPEDADLIFLEEIKCKEWPPEAQSEFAKYYKTLCISKELNGGYAGVALLSKIKPIKVWQGIDNAEFENEGRLIIAEFSRFYFMGSYVPNSGRGLVNLEKRGRWEKLLTSKIKELDKIKPVLYGGDLNVAHQEIDLANPASNRNKTAGFTDAERSWFDDLLNAGFKDTFRELHGDRQEYSYWSYMGNARSKNVGWRLDYFLVSNRIMEKVMSSEIRTSVMGSDHAPIVIEVNL